MINIKSSQSHFFLAFFGVFLFFGKFSVHAQPVDSVEILQNNLSFEKLEKDDIILFKPQKDQKVYAAGRILEDQKNIPRVIYVISKEQIALEGYSSLPDILKIIPGFRTSQPGSAQLGETFMNRGMVGNIYAKILINGLPINPSGAPGMPIGSQLPIQHAERIEIIVDPSSTLYGSDAMAGVINIVLPEIERPIQVNSSVRIGSNGLTEINTSIGGKLGKNKNVFSYNLFGTNKQITNYSIESSQFVVDTAAQNSPYYVGETGDQSIPEIVAIPHESSLIGLSTSFRDFTFVGSIMYRRDHAALGAHPSRISYSEPTDHLGETIYQGALQYNKNLNDNWSLLLNGSGLLYEVDGSSKYVGINHDISAGDNYQYGSSLDLRFEPIVSYNKNRFTVLAGGLVRASSGDNFQNFMKRPFIEEDKLITGPDGQLIVENSVVADDIIDSTSVFDSFSYNVFSIFSQLFYKGEKLNIIAGFRYENRTDVVEDIGPPDSTGGINSLDDLGNTVGAFNPSLAVLYYIKPNISVKGSYIRAFRTPGPYYQSNNYSSMQSAPIDSMGPPAQITFQRTNVLHQPEYLSTISFGASYYFANNSGNVSFSFFRNSLTNSLFTNIKRPVEGNNIPPPGGYYIGYLNRSTASVLNGFQLSYYKSYKNLDFDAHGAYYVGAEEIEDVASIDSYRSVPDFELKANVKARFLKKNAAGLNFQLYGPFVNHLILAKGEIFGDQTGSYYNIDLYLNRKFGRSLTASIKVNNLTNSINKGIFTNWLDGYDFNYVPQLNRRFTLSLVYRLD